MGFQYQNSLWFAILVVFSSCTVLGRTDYKMIYTWQVIFICTLPRKPKMSTCQYFVLLSQSFILFWNRMFLKKQCFRRDTDVTRKDIWSRDMPHCLARRKLLKVWLPDLIGKRKQGIFFILHSILLLINA